MARGLRASLAGYVYHVLNRANGRLRIFGKDGDFVAFEEIVAATAEQYPVRICGCCIMGNHWHMLLWPKEDGILSDFMRRLSLIRIPQYSRAFINVARKRARHPAFAKKLRRTSASPLQDMPRMAMLRRTSGEPPVPCSGLHCRTRII
jgi:REP element-mobilizing transposase RayT